MHTEKIGFVDVEASSLRKDSYPIEVGWAFVCLSGTKFERIESGCLLIRPRPEWLARPDAWSEASAGVHGISMQNLLGNGVPADEAAVHIGGVFGSSKMHSDAPDWDGRWLESLFDGAPVRKRFRVVDFSSAVERLTDLGYEYAYREAQRTAPITHRAEADAVHLATVFRLGVENPNGAETAVGPSPVIGWRRGR